jgi:FtsH-binding integral membrane protein
MLSKLRPIINNVKPKFISIKYVPRIKTRFFSIFAQDNKKNEDISLKSYINKVGISAGKLLAISAMTGGLTVGISNALINIPPDIDTFEYIDQYTPMIFTLYGLSCIGSFYHIWKLSDKTKTDSQKMYHAYWIHGIMGFIMAPSLIIFNQYIPQALILTSALVAGPIMGTRLIPKGSMLSLGPALSTALCGLVGIGFTSIGSSYFGFNALADITHSINIYGGIIIFTIYNSYYTERLIDDYEKGIKNYVDHAISYSLNIINIFVRILEVLRYLNQDDNED